MSEGSSFDELQNLAKQLEISIRNGNPYEAELLARRLAEQRVQCRIQIQEEFTGQDDYDPYDGGWACDACTFINVPGRPGCEMCAAPRPTYGATSDDDYTYYENDETRFSERSEQEQYTQDIETESTFHELLRLDEQAIIRNRDDFECPICTNSIGSGDGITLRECHHDFCKDCLVTHISTTEKAYIDCPFRDAEYTCESTLQDREIKALVPRDVYEKYQNRSMVAAESADPNTFHCQTANCRGWCFFEDDANEFMCPVCAMINCLTCRAIHEDKTCKMYQEWLKKQAQYNEEARKTQEALENMVKTGEALRCPFCEIIIQKKGGCDWIQCPACRQEICWITKGPRWGKGGRGDTSGGCKCRVNGMLCHRDCKNCH